jgi:hypothetical protein
MYRKYLWLFWGESMFQLQEPHRFINISDNMLSYVTSNLHRRGSSTWARTGIAPATKAKHPWPFPMCFPLPLSSGNKLVFFVSQWSINQCPAEDQCIPKLIIFRERRRIRRRHGWLKLGWVRLFWISWICSEARRNFSTMVTWTYMLIMLYSPHRIMLYSPHRDETCSSRIYIILDGHARFAAPPTVR